MVVVATDSLPASWSSRSKTSTPPKSNDGNFRSTSSFEITFTPPELESSLALVVAVTPVKDMKTVEPGNRAPKLPSEPKMCSCMKPGVLESVMHGRGMGGHGVRCLRNWGPMPQAVLVTVIGKGALPR